MRSCSASECSKGNKNNVVGCWCCRLDFCLDHYRGSTHTCLRLPMEECNAVTANARAQEFKDIIERVRSSLDLKAIAESQRPGHSCTVRYPTSYEDSEVFAGGYHLHLLLEFDDGVKWLARIRQTSSHLMSEGEGAMLTESATATQHAMHGAGLKVADAWLIGGNTAGLNICMLEFVQGTSWEDDRILDISNSKIRNTIQDYARFCIELSRLQFSQIGSLTRGSDGTLSVGPLAKGRANLPEAPWFNGPFKSQAERYLSFIDEHLQTWSVESAPTRQSPVLSYLLELELRDLIAQDPEMNRPATCTYIRHEELAPHNFMVDDEGHITAVIDWDWAHVTTKEEAFAAPYAFWDDYGCYEPRRDSLSQAEELLATTYVELGRSDLADCVRQGRRYQRMLNATSGLRYESFKDLVALFPGTEPLPNDKELLQHRLEKKFSKDPKLIELLCSASEGK